MSPLTIVVVGLLTALTGLLILWASQFRDIADGDPMEEDYWFRFDPSPTEALRAYAKRIGLSENLIDLLLIPAYNQGMGRYTGDPESREFYPFVIATVLELATHENALGWRMTETEVHSTGADIIHAQIMTAADWDFFIRMPRLWNMIDGRKSTILNGIYAAYWKKEPFQLGSYSGQLLQYL